MQHDFNDDDDNESGFPDDAVIHQGSLFDNASAPVGRFVSVSQSTRSTGASAAAINVLAAPPSTRAWIEPLRATALALAILMVILATAFGTLLGSAAFLRHLFPYRHFDALGALHQPLVLGLLVGASVLWVLPPHPWAAKPSGAAPLDFEGGAD